MGNGEAYTGFWWGKVRERDLSVDGRIILRWIFSKWDAGPCTGSIWPRIGVVGGHFVNAAMNLRLP